MSSKKPDKAVRFGVIGGGWVATARYLPVLLKDKRVEVVAVADQRRAAEVAARFRIPHQAKDMAELLQFDLDAVAICTPPWQHAPLTIQAISNGLHVLVEKPMAMTVAEGEGMVGAAQSQGVNLSVAHSFLFSRAMEKARREIESGALGEVISVMASQLSSPRRRLPTWYEDLPAGLFYDESPHMLYLLRYFLGAVEVGYTRMEKGSDQGGHGPKKIEASLVGEGRSGSLSMVFEAPVSEWILTVVGTRKVITLDLFRDIAVSLATDYGHRPKDVLSTALSRMYQEVMGLFGTGTRHLSKQLYFGHDRLIRRFVDSIVKGTPPPVTGEQGLEVLKLMHTILERCGEAGEGFGSDPG